MRTPPNNVLLAVIITHFRYPVRVRHDSTATEVPSSIYAVYLITECRILPISSDRWSRQLHWRTATFQSTSTAPRHRRVAAHSLPLFLLLLFDVFCPLPGHGSTSTSHRTCSTPSEFCGTALTTLSWSSLRPFHYRKAAHSVRRRISAAIWHVLSARSRTGLTSIRSIAATLRAPPSDCSTSTSCSGDRPPGTGVLVPGAQLGSTTSMSIET